MSEEQVRQIIRDELSHFMRASKYTFERPIQILDGNDITLSSDHGTRIGTAATQKLAFFGLTPRVQYPVIPHPNIQGATYNQTDAESLRSAVESLMDTLKAFGLNASA